LPFETTKEGLGVAIFPAFSINRQLKTRNKNGFFRIRNIERDP
jgi:hypothetical protein